MSSFFFLVTGAIDPVLKKKYFDRRHKETLFILERMKRRRMQAQDPFANLIPDILNIISDYYGFRFKIFWADDGEKKNQLDGWITFNQSNFYECETFMPLSKISGNFKFAKCELLDIKQSEEMTFCITKNKRELLCMRPKGKELCGYRVNSHRFRLSRYMFTFCEQGADCIWRKSFPNWKIIYGFPINVCRPEHFTDFKICISCLKRFHFFGFKKPIYRENQIFSQSVNPRNPVWVCDGCYPKMHDLNQIKKLKREYGGSEGPSLTRFCTIR